MVYLLGCLLMILLLWVSIPMLLGRFYGNRIAKFIGMPKNLFHTILDHGTNNTSLTLLNSMRLQGLKELEALRLIIPRMDVGIMKLQMKFGQQPQLLNAARTLQKFASETF